MKEKGILKHGIGYDLITVQESKRIVLAIKCHTCERISFNPNDITERYCGNCHKFHEENLISQQE